MASKERKGTNAIVRQGHTASIYGNNPAIEGKGLDHPPKDLKA